MAFRVPDERVRFEIHRRLPQFLFRMEIFDAWLEQALASCQSWLDVGCGRNDLLAEFAGSRLQVGVDKARHAGLVRKRNCRFVQAAAESLPFADGCFDVVTMRQVVEHLADPLGVFAEIRRVLRPGGRVLVVTTNRRAPLIRVARAIPQRLKMRLIRKLYGKAAEDVCPTFHRWNSWYRLHRAPPGFRCVRVVSTENPIREHLWLLRLSIVWMRLSDRGPLRAYWSNLIAEYQRL